MRRTRRLALSIVGISVLLAGCDVTVFGDGERGSGNVITESRSVSGFDEIVLDGSGDVVVTVTGSDAVTIEAEDNIMPLLTTEVRDGRLVLGAEGSYSPTRDITYTITVATLEGLTINGSGNMTAMGIDSARFSATINGSGNIDVVGTTDDLSVEINGSGNYEGEDLVADSADVDINGSGNAVVNASDTLKASIAGSGNVEYLGDPAVDASTPGSGDVRRR